MHLLQAVQILAILFLTVVRVSSSLQLCGSLEPQHNETCVSLRLPWQADPIYFCKEDFKYRKQCGQNQDSVHISCGRKLQKGNLLVATPWDCCPLSSNPDFCKNVQCPGKPFNRSCIEIPATKHGIDCCGKWFCDEKVKSENDCHNQFLKPSCQGPPENKTNCIGFIDLFGCCPMYQCKEDRKSGICPMESLNMQRIATPNPNPNPTEPADPDQESSSSEYNTSSSSAPAFPYIRYSRYPKTFSRNPLLSIDLECVGDFNCPGKMICCSHDVRVYGQTGLFPKNVNPTVGFCMEPLEL